MDIIKRESLYDKTSIDVIAELQYWNQITFVLLPIQEMFPKDEYQILTSVDKLIGIRQHTNKVLFHKYLWPCLLL